ncbi:MAG: hypothetical protein A2Y07_06075 [Planctomycetes bacterium GWF2_50_10]|nr:MAG: hypothetical protein A2Y07_06075 [Planctomycetes bacterium GWF2_50_10]
MENVIEIQNLTKFFGGKCVLENINLKIPQGTAYGLLGRNGAGKTTLIRMLMGLDSPTAGTISILDKDPFELAPADRARIGYVAEGHHLIQDYKVSRLIDLAKSLSPNWDNQQFARLLTVFKFPTTSKVRQLSTGQRAQLNLSLALAIQPDILILDDPTLGLDTVARRQFLELAVDLISSQNRTVLFSSHILSDVERIADRVGILIGRHLAVDCDLEYLKQSIRKFRLRFDTGIPEKIHLTEIVRQSRTNGELILTIANWDTIKEQILDLYKPADVTEVPMSLEDIFIECSIQQEVSC